VKNEPGKKLLISDGVFSMDGDIGPLPGLCDAAEKYGAIMMVDDAHASGVWAARARHRRITSECTGALTFRRAIVKAIALSVDTSVALASDRFSLPPRAPFLFSTSHPPSVLATLHVMRDRSTSRTKPQWMAQLGPTPASGKKNSPARLQHRRQHSQETQVTPIIMATERLTMAFSRELFKRRNSEPASVSDGPEGKARIRTIMTATHTKEELTAGAWSVAARGKKDGDSR